MKPLKNGQLVYGEAAQMFLAATAAVERLQAEKTKDEPPKPSFQPPKATPTYRPAAPPRVSLLRSEFNYLAYAMAPAGDFRMHREEEGRVRMRLSPRGESLLRKWRAASSQERRTATERLDAQAREWRLKRTGVQLPSKELILPPGVKR